ncbi:hypothetical protein SE959_01480 [Escherichia coli]|nr:hypothetical protein [Escherichia coli]
MTDAWTLKGGVTTGYKAPPWDSYIRGSAVYPGRDVLIYSVTPNWKPEESVSYEAGYITITSPV